MRRGGESSEKMLSSPCQEDPSASGVGRRVDDVDHWVPITHIMNPSSQLVKGSRVNKDSMTS